MCMAVLAFVVDGILRAAFVVRHDAPRPRRLLGHRYDVIAIASAHTRLIEIGLNAADPRIATLLELSRSLNGAVPVRIRIALAANPSPAR